MQLQDFLAAGYEDHFIKEWPPSEFDYNNRFENCTYCNGYFDACIDLAWGVAFFLHPSSGCSAQFVPKYPPESIMMSSNMAEQICRYCFEHFMHIEIPQVLNSFQLDLNTVAQAVPFDIPTDISRLILLYANPAAHLIQSNLKTQL